MNTRTRHEWWRPVLSDGSEASAPAPLAARVSKLSFWALLAFTIILILAPQNYIPALKPLHLAFVFAVVAAAAYLFERFQHGAFDMGRRPEFMWAALLLLWALVTVPFSLWPGGSVNTITNIFLKAVIIFWLLGSVIDTPARLKKVAWLLTLISIPLSLTAVHSFATGAFAQEGAGGGRIAGFESGLTGNPNDLAMMLNLIFPLTVGLIFCTKRFSLRVLLSFIALLDMLAVVATYSRGGFLMLAVILIALGVCLWRRGAWVPVAAFLALLAVALPAASLMHGGYIQRLSTITSVQSDTTGSSEARLHGMKDAASYALHHPVLGSGIGTSQLALNQMREENKWHLVHDVYLRYAMELGGPGIVLFLLLLYGTLKSCWRARRVAAGRDDQRDFYFMAEALGISLIGYMVGAIFSPSAYQFFFYYFAGLAVAAGGIAARLLAQDKPERAVELPGRP